MIHVVKVNQKHSNFTHYIGRAWAGLPSSMYHNPFHLGKDGDRVEVLLKFAEYWYSPEQKPLRDKALMMFSSDSVLGCWCHPLLCHGDIEAGYVNWKHHKELQIRLDWSPQ